MEFNSWLSQGRREDNSTSFNRSKDYDIYHDVAKERESRVGGFNRCHDSSEMVCVCVCAHACVCEPRNAMFEVCVELIRLVPSSNSILVPGCYGHSAWAFYTLRRSYRRSKWRLWYFELCCFVICESIKDEWNLWLCLYQWDIWRSSYQLSCCLICKKGEQAAVFCLKLWSLCQ